MARRFAVPRRVVALAAAGVLVVGGATTGVVLVDHHSKAETSEQAREAAGEGDGDSPAQRAHERKNAAGEAGEESATLKGLFAAFSDARQLGLLKDPGAYTAAYDHLRGMPVASSSWSEVTNKPYDADDPHYADPVSSNSGGGAGFVTGRIVGLAVDPSTHGGPSQPVYAAGAQGGVWRSLDDGATWTPIADQILTLATGDLRVAPDGSLWYGTGEPNYGDGLGSGVYRLAEPWKATSFFTPADRVGGKELESHWVGKLAFDGQYAFAATSRGVYRHAFPVTAANQAQPWADVLAPVQPQTSVTQNIVNDVVIQPGTGNVLANVAYRGELPYNGFYLSRDHGTTWTKINPTGAINPKEVGPADMAYSADGKSLYIVMESTVDFDSKASALAGVYVSRNNGDPAGPWNQIASPRKLVESGSAMKPQVIGTKTYPVGIQAWYNRSIGVDPGDSNHVYVGIEEVYETRNGGAQWNTVGRYWNFGFPCAPTRTCDGNTVHSDQHSIAFGNGKVYVGNDGGLYSRKVDGSQQSWDSLSRSGQLRALQYYGIGVGALSAADGGGVAVWGGMQDNGVSLLRAKDGGRQVSPMGGDGGRMLVDPANGCRAVGEYTNLTLQLTTQCGQSDGAVTIQQIAPGDAAAQFIAPFAADDNAAYADKYWVAGGRYVWENTKTWASTTASNGWSKAFDLTAGSNPAASATSIASQTHDAGGTPVHVVYAGWCGSCSSATYNSGVATNYGGTWHQLPMKYLRGGQLVDMPKRYVSAVTIDPADQSGKTVYVTYNGFSAHYVEGFGAGFGHVFKSVDGGQTFVDVSGDPTAVDGLPDVPMSDLSIDSHGTRYVATDLGVFVSLAGQDGNWARVGTSLPTTISSDLQLFTSGGTTTLYAGTFGRGIWSTTVPATWTVRGAG